MTTDTPDTAMADSSIAEAVAEKPARTGATVGAPPVAESSATARLSAAERLNFLLTNRIPRRWATLFMGWYSQIESPTLTRLSLAIWRLFADDLRLFEAETTTFRSLRECFTRRLKPGARSFDEHPLIASSPCDAIVGECGRIRGQQLIQAKGFPYTLGELLADSQLAERYRNGSFVTLRLKSSMYHRFHAPLDCRVDTVSYISGDTWNVNPVALKCVEKLFCRNERAVIELQTADPAHAITLVPVAAVLVASIQLHGLDYPLDLRYRGPNRIACQQAFSKGDEMGYFQHGSTIIVLAPAGASLAPDVAPGTLLRAGQPLLQLPPRSQRCHKNVTQA